MSIVAALIKAERECTKRRDIKPNKVLRPIGTTFKERTNNPCSTALPHWSWWKVVDYIQSFRGRSGNTLFYERMESIEGIENPDGS